MKSIFNLLEKILLMLSILCVLFLLVIQYISYGNNYTIYTSKFRKESKFLPLSNSEYYEKGVIILKNMAPDYKNIEVLVNGDYISSFTNNDEIQVYVYDNDIIEIDGTKYNDKLQVKIVGISNNIDTPKLDTVITTSQSIEILSKVQLK